MPSITDRVRENSLYQLIAVSFAREYFKNKSAGTITITADSKFNINPRANAEAKTIISHKHYLRELTFPVGGSLQVQEKTTVSFPFDIEMEASEAGIVKVTRAKSQDFLWEFNLNEKLALEQASGPKEKPPSKVYSPGTLSDVLAQLGKESTDVFSEEVDTEKETLKKPKVVFRCGDDSSDEEDELDDEPTLQGVSAVTKAGNFESAQSSFYSATLVPVKIPGIVQG